MTNPYSLSTSWNASNHHNARDLIKEIKEAGFDTVELSFALSKEMVDDIVKMKRSGEIRVSSLHNMCPIPEGMARSRATPDYYSLASLDERERRLAVETARSTIRYATILGAKAIVLHTGFVDVRDRLREFAAAFNDQEKREAVKRDMVRERDARKKPHIDSLVKSLKELVPEALSGGVKLAVETRYHYRDIPLVDEYDGIFANFRDGELFYWHDVGHAEAFDRLGLARHEDYLKRFQNRLIGIHLHDIIGLIYDHNAPGAGEFDFSLLRPYIKKDTIKVIEAHQPASAEALRKSVVYLNSVLGSQEGL